WTADGKAVVWALGSTIYRQALAADKPEAIEVVVEAPRARPHGSIVLTGARIVTMKGAGDSGVIEKGDVVITDNRVAQVGAVGTVKRPAGARIIDVTGKTIIPGFVDVHAHMWPPHGVQDRKSTRLNSSHRTISYAVFCLKKKKRTNACLIPAARLAI